MMYPTYGVHTPDTLPLSSPQDVFLDDASKQRALRRLSKSSSGQRAGAASTRVSKPNSTSSSPRSSSMAGRRRTMMANDSWTPQRQQQVLDYFSAPPKQTTRPVSWHPSCIHQQFVPQPPSEQQQHQHHQQQQYLQHQHAAYAVPNSSLFGADYTEMYGGQPQFSPMMTSYSNDTSPSSTFSPLPMFPASDQVQYAQGAEWNESQKPCSAYNFGENLSLAEPLAALHNQVNTRNAGASELDWNSFIMQGFNNTTPPTPEAFSQTRQPPVMPQGSMLYEPLDEPEEEGEILVGMGLYDTPDKVCEDPQLNNYRSTVSSLLGSPYRQQEPKGKGLKLEETWEPPAKTDHDADDDEDDGDDDA